MSRCEYLSPWGRCQQPATGDLCSYHRHIASEGGRHDAFYHRKIVLGLCRPTWDTLTDTEVEALFHGRRRADGRRLDHYVIEDKGGSRAGR